MDKKKVMCLYRVSTKLQVKENDIPMQREECRKFIEKQPDWEFYDERLEKGVSGFKNATQDRDILIEILEMARNHTFDILLVYMSDRIGRRGEETALFVSQLNEFRIEVWSTTEGQLKTEEHIDKLLNFMRFWTAQGESIHTSQRVRDSQLGMLKRGQYVGGGRPFGYDQVYSGKQNNKGKMLKELKINPEQAEVVRRIFELSTFHNIGSFRIAQELNSSNVPNQKDSKWTASTINSILKNPIYKGYYTYGKSRYKGKRGRTSPDDWIYSEVQIPELIIIEDYLWDKAQKVREARTAIHCRKDGIEYSGSPTKSTGQLLLLGLAYCGYCGRRLTNGSMYDKWVNKDGTKRNIMRGRYRCINKGEGGECTGYFYYKQKTIEGVVIDSVSRYMEKLKNMDIHAKVIAEQKSQQQKEQKELSAIQSQIQSIEKDINTLKAEIPQALRNESVLPLPELKELINDKKEQLEGARNSLQRKQAEINSYSLSHQDLERLSHLIPKWEGFNQLEIPQKQLILSNIIERVEVKRGEIEIKMRIRLEDFLPPIYGATGDPLDWCSTNVARITYKVVSKIEENDIILMHDSFETTVTAALEIIDTLQKQGYTFVTVEEILFD